jgi:hypothetical protein
VGQRAARQIAESGSQRRLKRLTNLKVTGGMYELH